MNILGLFLVISCIIFFIFTTDWNLRRSWFGFGFLTIPYIHIYLVDNDISQGLRTFYGVIAIVGLILICSSSKKYFND